MAMVQSHMSILPKPGVYTSSENGSSEVDELEHQQKTPLYVIPKREPEVFVCGESAMHNREKMQRMGQLKKCPVQINPHRKFPCQNGKETRQSSIYWTS
ncbi:hypothetical protein L596_000347 [Steinernema carpocapsae]|uniref:Uncharacterized protein n=1 Tax=Steinernema carpocapsae TaxID=34508 RepID=A0A4U8UJ98_STECR|nr:hypothetical protein L596_000347 [Steinernema carpocapsae]